MAAHTINLTTGQEEAVAEIAAWLLTQDPAKGDGTVNAALPHLIRYAVERLGGQAAAAWNERFRTRVENLTAQQRAEITAILGG